MKAKSKNIPISSFWVVTYTTIVVASLVLTNKILEWHGIILSACLISFPLIYLFGDIVAEVYGYKESQKLIWFTIMSCIIFSIITQAAIYIPSANFYNNSAAYQQVLGQDLKFTLVGCLAIVLGAQVNMYAITKWKLLLNGRYFWLRSIGATALGELVNSLVAFPLGFFGDFPFHNIMEVMFFSYILKMIYAVLLVYPASLVVTYYKAKGINANDVDFSFNPFVKQLVE